MRGLESRRPGVAANGTTPARTHRRRFAARAGGGAPTTARERERERERESGVSRAAAAVGQRTRTRIHTHRCGPSLSSRFLEAGPDVARETENADLRRRRPPSPPVRPPARPPRSSSELVDSRFGRGLTSRRSRGAPYASARSLGWRLRAVVTEEGEK
jgi:hypothetical protein